MWRLVEVVVLGATVIFPTMAQTLVYPTEYYFTTTITAPPDPTATGCPTITATTNQCRTCAYPMCLVLSTLTQGCSCPETVATAFTSHPCDQRCGGIGCSTSWSIVSVPSCASSSSSHSISISVSKSSASSTSTAKSDSVCTSSGTPLPPPPSPTPKHSNGTLSSVRTPPLPSTTSAAVVANGARRLTPFKLW
ncbi:hypothetical protein B0H67DRAFT_566730 [Lasiosphaeris hirsuta]|uniref:Uncharacterized protein n=1 Tax=Lasiosphaeris hirsuta TaxID=260670 RepID=A0AA40BDA2_9PEZI|nr:hypothetical protein B0H67DRAFT_566730 [Lasiosphaeris hirsuta]